MKHLPIEELFRLAAEAVITDQEASEHLSECEYCRSLLRTYVQTRTNTIKKPVSPQKMSA